MSIKITKAHEKLALEIIEKYIDYINQEAKIRKFRNLFNMHAKKRMAKEKMYQVQIITREIAQKENLANDNPATLLIFARIARVFKLDMSEVPF